MADFKKALNITLQNEGGYSDHPDDTGGETYCGISQKLLNQLGIDKLPSQLNFNEISSIYNKNFWRFDHVQSQEVANKIFDMAVNFGLSVAIRYAQLCVNNILCEQKLKIDGICGRKTLDSLNGLCDRFLLSELRVKCVAHYYRIIVNNNSQLAFIKGWLRRALS